MGQSTTRQRQGGMRARLVACRAGVRRHRLLDLTWRLTVFLVGTAALVTGVVGLVFPVLPGWALIFIGLAVLASEFAWAERWLHQARNTAARARDTAMRRGRRGSSPRRDASGAGSERASRTRRDDLGAGVEERVT